MHIWLVRVPVVTNKAGMPIALSATEAASRLPIAHESDRTQGHSGLVAWISRVLLKGITLIKCVWSAALN